MCCQHNERTVLNPFPMPGSKSSDFRHFFKAFKQHFGSALRGCPRKVLDVVGKAGKCVHQTNPKTILEVLA